MYVSDICYRVLLIAARSSQIKDEFNSYPAKLIWQKMHRNNSAKVFIICGRHQRYLPSMKLNKSYYPKILKNVISKNLKERKFMKR